MSRRREVQLSSTDCPMTICDNTDFLGKRKLAAKSYRRWPISVHNMQKNVGTPVTCSTMRCASFHRALLLPPVHSQERGKGIDLCWPLLLLHMGCRASTSSNNTQARQSAGLCCNLCVQYLTLVHMLKDQADNLSVSLFLNQWLPIAPPTATQYVYIYICVCVCIRVCVATGMWFECSSAMQAHVNGATAPHLCNNI